MLVRGTRPVNNTAFSETLGLTNFIFRLVNNVNFETFFQGGECHQYVFCFLCCCFVVAVVGVLCTGQDGVFHICCQYLCPSRRAIKQSFFIFYKKSEMSLESQLPFNRCSVVFSCKIVCCGYSTKQVQSVTYDYSCPLLICSFLNL